MIQLKSAIICSGKLLTISSRKTNDGIEHFLVLLEKKKLQPLKSQLLIAKLCQLQAYKEPSRFPANELSNEPICTNIQSHKSIRLELNIQPSIYIHQFSNKLFMKLLLSVP
jgi:hypothetical protein